MSEKILEQRNNEMAETNNEIAEKMKMLEASIFAIEKEFGKGSIMRLGAKQAVAVDVIPSGSLLLDAAMGIGGYPRGRIIEIYGPESSGKTTLTLHAIAEAQKKNGIAAFVDAEHALDPVYAKALGVNINDLWVSQPDTGEQVPHPSSQPPPSLPLWSPSVCQVQVTEPGGGRVLQCAGG